MKPSRDRRVSINIATSMIRDGSRIETLALPALAIPEPSLLS
jgi:hypothetical protein